MHTGSHHTEEAKEKMRQVKLGCHLSEEHKKKIGVASKQIGISKETRAKMVASRKVNGTYVCSEAQRRKLSEVRRRRMITAETRAKLGRTTKGHRYALGYRHTPETRAHMSEVHKCHWQNSAYREAVIKNSRAAANIRPDKPEGLVLSMFNEIAPNEWAFVGDGQLIIGGRNPDIANVNGHKKLCEIFGRYWHGQRARCYEETEEGRKALFAKYGYDTLVIWEDELKETRTVKEKIRQFCEVGHGHTHLCKA